MGTTHKKYIAIFILVVLAGAATSLGKGIRAVPGAGIYTEKRISIGNTEIVVEIADTDAKRQLGLSGRDSLLRGRGMLFVFDKPGNYGFWMKDMKFPIDIIWIDSDMRIVGVEENVSPNTFPKSFYPLSPVLFVLETPALFSSSHHVEVGGSITFTHQ